MEWLRTFHRGPTWLAVLIAIQLQAAGMARSAPMPVSAELHTYAVATMGADQDLRDDSLSVSFPADSAALDVEALAMEGQGSSRAFESISATFGAWGGSLDLEFGIGILNPDRNSSASAQVGGHDPWSYTFVPDSDAVLLVTYQVGGVASLYFESTGASAEQVYGSGTLRRDLVADQSTTLGVYMPSGPSCFGVCDGASSTGYGYFSWTIVPEPSTASLVGGGLIGLGLIRRARTRLSSR